MLGIIPLLQHVVRKCLSSLALYNFNLTFSKFRSSDNSFLDYTVLVDAFKAVLNNSYY